MIENMLLYVLVSQYHNGRERLALSEGTMAEDSHIRVMAQGTSQNSHP